MNNTDIRWQQRFANFSKALIQLKKAVELKEQRELSDLEKQGFIQAFEYTHELAWKTLKDFHEHQGNTEIYGSKDTTRESFKLGLITNGEIWMDMIQSRNQSLHTYDIEITDEIISLIEKKYLKEFKKLQLKLNELINL